MSILGIIIGIAICCISYKLVEWIKNKATDSIDLIPPEGIEKEKWSNVIGKDIKEPGKWLGILERVLIFLAVWVQEYTIIVAWLVFKVGTKWEVWSNIVKVPDSIGESSALSYLQARRAWGAKLLSSFLIGTISNILIGLIVASAIKYILKYLNC